MIKERLPLKACDDDAAPKLEGNFQWNLSQVYEGPAFSSICRGQAALTPRVTAKVDVLICVPGER